MCHVVKGDTKRVQKFHEHPDQFKKLFNTMKYPKKDDGCRIVTGEVKHLTKDGKVNFLHDEDEDIF